MGKVGNDGNLYNSYVTSITQRQTQAGRGAFENGRQSGTPEADFGSRLEGISSYNQGSSAGSITARGGETLAIRGPIQRSRANALTPDKPGHQDNG